MRPSTVTTLDYRKLDFYHCQCLHSLHPQFYLKLFTWIEKQLIKKPSSSIYKPKMKHYVTQTYIYYDKAAKDKQLIVDGTPLTNWVHQLTVASKGLILRVRSNYSKEDISKDVTLVNFGNIQMIRNLIREPFDLLLDYHVQFRNDSIHYEFTHLIKRYIKHYLLTFSKKEPTEFEAVILSGGFHMLFSLMITGAFEGTISLSTVRYIVDILLSEFQTQVYALTEES